MKQEICKCNNSENIIKTFNLIQCKKCRFIKKIEYQVEKPQQEETSSYFVNKMDYSVAQQLQEWHKNYIDDKFNLQSEENKILEIIQKVKELENENFKKIKYYDFIITEMVKTIRKLEDENNILKQQLCKFNFDKYTVEELKEE